MPKKKAVNSLTSSQNLPIGEVPQFIFILEVILSNLHTILSIRNNIVVHSGGAKIELHYSSTQMHTTILL